jgi:hypothetical protein
MGPKSWPDRPDAAASALAWCHSAVCSSTSPVATNVNVRGGVVVLVAGEVVVLDAASQAPILDDALDLAERLVAAADAGRVDLGDLGRRARRLLGATTGWAGADEPTPKRPG